MFENYIKELEEIVNKLESGNVGVEESIELFKHGTELSRKCLNIIDNGKESIKEIKKNLYGEIEEIPASFE